MKPELQRIAIAEACGFESCDTGGDCWIRNKGHFTISGGGGTAKLPDYLNDLNAMHEAEVYAGEHLMDADQWEEYGHALERMHPHACLKTPNEEKVDYYDFATLMVELTAAQRAEAFLRTLGLWKD